MIRLAFFVAIASAWTAALVVVGAYAGWTFVAMKQAGVTNLADPSFAGIEAEMLSRYVGGQITRMPFDVMSWSSIYIPALLSLFIGGIPAQPLGPMRWLRRGVIALLGVAVLVAIALTMSGIELRDASAQYWAAVVAHDASAAALAKDALDAVHGRAQSIYLSMTGIASLSTVLGAVFLTRRSAIISRI